MGNAGFCPSTVCDYMVSDLGLSDYGDLNPKDMLSCVRPTGFRVSGVYSCGNHPNRPLNPQLLKRNRLGVVQTHLSPKPALAFLQALNAESRSTWFLAQGLGVRRSGFRVCNRDLAERTPSRKHPRDGLSMRHFSDRTCSHSADISGAGKAGEEDLD